MYRGYCSMYYFGWMLIFIFEIAQKPRRETVWGGCLSFSEAAMEARGYIGVDVVFGVDACLFLRL